MPGTLSFRDVIRSGTAREPSELRRSGVAGAGPRSTRPIPSRPPCLRGEGGRRGISVPSPSPCPQGCCQPQGQDLSTGSSLLPSRPAPGGSCGAAGLVGVPLQRIPALGNPQLTRWAVQPSKPPILIVFFPLVASNKLHFPYLSFPRSEEEGYFYYFFF